MSRALNKAERLLQLEALLLSHPEGLRRAQIAIRLGVERSTAGRYVTALTSLVPIVEEDDGRLWIDRSRYLPPVRLSAHESESVRLAFRLFSRKIRLPFPHASACLRKLAVATERASPRLCRRLQETADSLDCHAFPSFTRKYREVMERLIEASADHRAVRLCHLSARRAKTDEYLFHPYCLEPYPDGNSVHAIGFCPEIREMRTFKLERIRWVRLMEERFQAPGDFDVDAYTSTAWGIWGRTGQKPVRVVLLFSSAVAERVRETVWHESQTLDPEGSMIL
jgi:predicted DNA-binding transcriptional regulator YafY